MVRDNSEQPRIEPVAAANIDAAFASYGVRSREATGQALPAHLVGVAEVPAIGSPASILLRTAAEAAQLDAIDQAAQGRDAERAGYYHSSRVPNRVGETAVIPQIVGGEA